MTVDAGQHEILNWLGGDPDVFTRPGAVDLQSALHRNMMTHFADADAAARFLGSDMTHWRQQAIVKAQQVVGRPIGGTILEIGAGSGWCSGLLSFLPTVAHIYCMDYDPVAVSTLMPQVHGAIGANTWKIQRVLGTFNSMPLRGEVDFVVSLGALHHSENLHATLTACFEVLKPGGWLIASEPTYPDNETNASLQARYKREDANALKKYGRAARHEENSDHYYRLSEFIVAGYSAKFDVYPFVFDLSGNRHVDDRTLAERRTASGFHLNVLYPYFAKNPANPMFDKLLYVLQKPSDGGCELGHILSAAKLAY
jgi:SAM-dependent methyltransferase